MPLFEVNSSTSSKKEIVRLEKQLFIARRALEQIYLYAHDFGDYWSCDVAKEALAKMLKDLPPAKAPDAQPTETKASG